MRYRIWFLALLVVAAIVYLGRAQLAPYLPDVVARHLSSQKPAETAADTKGSGNRRQGGAAASNRPVSVTVAKAKAGSMPVMRKTIGTIVPFASTALSSLTSGTIAEILVKDGAEVKAGDLLVRLDDRTINANIQRDTATLAKDQATLDEATSNLKRVQTLSDAGAGTKQQYDDAVAAAKQAQAAIAVDQANLVADRVLLDDTEIRAPFDGKLGVVQQSLGAYVGPGAAIVTLTQMKPVYAEFNLPETELDLARTALLNNTLTVEISPALSRPDAPKMSGPITFIDNAVDAASGTFKLRARLDNTDNALWPGQALDVAVNAGERNDLVIVPAVSVQQHDDGPICYVVGPDEMVSLRKVDVAFSVGDMTGIASGLKDGETVVTEGQAALIAGSHVTVVEAPGSAGSDSQKIAEDTPRAQNARVKQ
jgi:multidrug efflux system membrane fusion protein